jgi:tetratricopeptide (TPR) repeat protein
MKVAAKSNNRKLWPLILLGALFSCDFTPPLNKEILSAQSYIAKQDYQSAVNKYQKILEKNPPKDIQVKINYQLGDLYSIYLAENKKSVKYYEEIMKISDDPLWLVKTQERLGEINFTYLKDYRVSEEIYKKLSEFRPKLAKQDFYFFRYALSSYENDNPIKSLQLFKEIKRNKKHEYNTKSYYYEGLIYFELKQWDFAINSWNEYLKKENRKDNIVQAKFLMANAYETQEELKKAYNLYYSILGEYPNTEVIQNRLKAIYERRIARKR